VCHNYMAVNGTVFISTLTRDIDIAILSVCPSVRLFVRPSVGP